jgi:hypothetical protein
MKHGELMKVDTHGTYVWRSEWHSLAAATGRSVEEIVRAAAADELRSLIGPDLAGARIERERTEVSREVEARRLRAQADAAASEARLAARAREDPRVALQVLEARSESRAFSCPGCSGGLRYPGEYCHCGGEGKGAVFRAELLSLPPRAAGRLNGSRARALLWGKRLGP